MGKRGTGARSQLSKQSSVVSPGKLNRERTPLTLPQMNERSKIMEASDSSICTLLCQTFDRLEQALYDLSDK